jgi:hypothetical protein
VEEAGVAGIPPVAHGAIHDCFGPSALSGSLFCDSWGDAPGWYETGPLALRTRCVPPSPGVGPGSHSAPKARPHTSPGQRPGLSASTHLRAEGPLYPPRVSRTATRQVSRWFFHRFRVLNERHSGYWLRCLRHRACGIGARRRIQIQNPKSPSGPHPFSRSSALSDSRQRIQTPLLSGT